jgi:hypothetical protein
MNLLRKRHDGSQHPDRLLALKNNVLRVFADATRQYQFILNYY